MSGGDAPVPDGWPERWPTEAAARAAALVDAAVSDIDAGLDPTGTLLELAAVGGSWWAIRETQSLVLQIPASREQFRAAPFARVGTFLLTACLVDAVAGWEAARAADAAAEGRDWLEAAGLASDNPATLEGLAELDAPPQQGYLSPGAEDANEERMDAVSQLLNPELNELVGTPAVDRFPWWTRQNRPEAPPQCYPHGCDDPEFCLGVCVAVTVIEAADIAGFRADPGSDPVWRLADEADVHAPLRALWVGAVALWCLRRASAGAGPE